MKSKVISNYLLEILGISSNVFHTCRKFSIRKYTETEESIQLFLEDDKLVVPIKSERIADYGLRLLRGIESSCS